MEQELGKERKTRLCFIPYSVQYVYIEDVIKDKTHVGIRIGGGKVTALSFVDNIAFCTEEKKDLSFLIAKPEEILGMHEIKLYKNKTKPILCSKWGKKRIDISINIWVSAKWLPFWQ